MESGCHGIECSVLKVRPGVGRRNAGDKVDDDESLHLYVTDFRSAMRETGDEVYIGRAIKKKGLRK